MFEIGVTVIVPPVPKNVPEVHEPENHFQIAPVPKLPPLRESTELLPGQIEEGLAIAKEAELDEKYKSTKVETQIVVLQIPTALT